MGKSPLRLIVRRRWEDMLFYVDTLECGHEQHHIRLDEWDDTGHLVPVNPREKRRRCQPCAREAIRPELRLPPKKPSRSEPAVSITKVALKIAAARNPTPAPLKPSWKGRNDNDSIPQPERRAKRK